MSTMPIDGLRAKAERNRSHAAYEKQQSRRMLVALFLLLAAIAIVAYRDRGSLFGSESAEERKVPATAQSAPVVPAVTVPAASNTENVVPVPVEKAAPLAATSSASLRPDSGAAAPVAPRKSAELRTKVATAPVKAAAPKATTSAATVTSAASERTPLVAAGPDAYPVLEQRTRVEGSVVLRALIGRDGHIEDLRVLRGAAVLGSAAREAVSQWKFKPYTENGTPVETYATITVNFTIRVADGSPKTVASLAPENVILLADDYRR